ncbi:MAG: hypothetical protein RLZZ444_1159 [Pseudomonadota bacterium]|jgi:hypothetical protein
MLQVECQLLSEPAIRSVRYRLAAMRLKFGRRRRLRPIPKADVRWDEAGWATVRPFRKTPGVSGRSFIRGAMAAARPKLRHRPVASRRGTRQFKKRLPLRSSRKRTARGPRVPSERLLVFACEKIASGKRDGYGEVGGRHTSPAVLVLVATARDCGNRRLPVAIAC